MTNRSASVCRDTKETSVKVSVCLDGRGESNTQTGLGFLDHMLQCLSKHARIDLHLQCDGDLTVDDHHTVEDCALALGQAIDQALGDRSGVVRFGHAYAPLDESLARVVVDLSGRPSSYVRLELRRDAIGDVSCENLSHFLCSLALTARLTLHAEVLRGENDHHRVEATFKALALALRAATTLDPGVEGVPSTKGVL